MALISKLSFLLLLSITVVASAAGYGNVDAPKPNFPTQNDYSNDKPNQLLHPLDIAVQGIVYCKSGTKLIPLEGALARITCLGVDNYGYESAPFSMLSHPTDAKGYFFTSFSLYDQFKDAVKITECKAFLESSPLQSCKIPTDVNRGHTGTLLSSYRLVGAEKMKTKLYSVGPFVYDTESKSSSDSNGNGY